jgi:hypothetical protein
MKIIEVEINCFIQKNYVLITSTPCFIITTSATFQNGWLYFGESLKFKFRTLFNLKQYLQIILKNASLLVLTRLTDDGAFGIFAIWDFSFWQ